MAQNAAVCGRPDSWLGHLRVTSRPVPIPLIGTVSREADPNPPPDAGGPNLFIRKSLRTIRMTAPSVPRGEDIDDRPDGFCSIARMAKVGHSGEDGVRAMSRRPILMLAVGVVSALLALSVFPKHAHGKGHAHGGQAHGAHHRAHHAGSSGLWRQNSMPASPGAGHTPAGRTSGVPQTATSLRGSPPTVLPSPDGP